MNKYKDIFDLVLNIFFIAFMTLSHMKKIQFYMLLRLVIPHKPYVVPGKHLQ